MSIDRDNYEPIRGNPRRKTLREDNAEEEPTAKDKKESGPTQGPNGDQGQEEETAGPTGDPEGTGGSHSPSPNASEPEDKETYKTPQGRTRRVKVTPQDWQALEEAAERLGGLPHSKVYNRAFQELRKRLDGM